MPLQAAIGSAPVKKGRPANAALSVLPTGIPAAPARRFPNLLTCHMLVLAFLRPAEICRLCAVSRGVKLFCDELAESSLEAILGLSSSPLPEQERRPLGSLRDSSTKIPQGEEQQPCPPRPPLLPKSTSLPSSEGGGTSSSRRDRAPPGVVGARLVAELAWFIAESAKMREETYYPGDGDAPTVEGVGGVAVMCTQHRVMRKQCVMAAG